MPTGTSPTLDKLTYAGRKENLHDVMDNPRHTFVHGDICDAAVAGPLVEAADYVVHFAAETHVDRSIMAAGDFIKTDVEGSFVLLEAARRNPGLKRFIQISTDEVYGSVPEGSSTETDELKPRNPYSASKAGADRLAYSYWATLRRAGHRHARLEQLRALPVSRKDPAAVRHQPDRQHPGAALRRRRQHPRLAARARPLPRAGSVDRTPRTNGEVYNIGGGNEVKNIDLTHDVLKLMGKGTDADQAGGRPQGPRPPLQPRHQEARGHGLEAAGAVRTGPARHRRLVPGQRVVVAPDQGTRPRLTRPTSKRSTASAADGIGPSSSPARPASSAATCSSCSRRTPPTSSAWQRPGTEPLLVCGGVHWETVEMQDRDEVHAAINATAALAVYHLAGVPARRRFLEPHARDVRRQRAGHPSSLRCASPRRPWPRASW